MSTALTRWRVRCEACGRELTDSSETFIRDSADVHRNVCEKLESDDDVVVEEVDG